MKKKKIQISAAESQVMEALWRKSPLSPEEIIAATAKANDWGPGTVRTLITRLLRKGARAGARQSRAHERHPPRAADGLDRRRDRPRHGGSP